VANAGTSTAVQPVSYFRSCPARLFRYLAFRTPLPYSIVRRLAPVLVGSRTWERQIYDFRMRLSLRDILQTRLLLDGLWEPVLTRWWAFLAAHATVIVDVGAHCGYYTLFARSVNPDADVHAFEPNARLCEDLTANLALNGYANKVHLHRMAIGRADGSAQLYIRDIEPAAATLNRPEIYDRTTTVPTVNLDSFLAGNGIDSVDLCKVDIEGAELDAVRGIEQGLRDKKYGRFVIEVHSLYMPDDGGPGELREIFERHGYGVYRIDESGATALPKGQPIPAFDQWLVLSPDADRELDGHRIDGRIQIPAEFAAIFEGASWAPAGMG
jgi:FkbM family methyltransferase